MPAYVAQTEYHTNTTVQDQVYTQSITHLADGGYVIIYYAGDFIPEPANWIEGDLYGQIFDASGNKVGGEFTVNSSTSLDQYGGQTVALADGGFVVSWLSSDVADQIAGTGSGTIMTQRFDAAGIKVGDEVTVGTSTPDAAPKIVAMADGGYNVYWTASSPNGYYGQVRHYDAAGIASAAEGGVAYYLDAAASVTISGEPVVAVTYNNGEVYGQLLGTSGTQPDNFIQVNTYTTGTQTLSALAALSGGGGVITWASSGQDGSSFGIYAQMYDTEGDALGAEFRVNTYTAGSQSVPGIIGLSTGGFVIVWQSNGQDGSGSGVYGQVYDASGVPVDGEFRIADEVVGYQGQALVTALDDGAFAVTWSSSTGVYTREYLPNSDPNQSPPSDDGDNDLSGGGGNDSLYGLGGSDHMDGNDGNDLLDGGTGGDAMRGGNGDDTYVVDDWGDFVGEFAGQGFDTVQTSLDGYTLPDNLEALTLTGNAIFGNGNELGNVLTGNAGHNVLDGGAGDDLINSGGGFDTLYGGAGADTLNASNAGGVLWNGDSKTVGLATEDFAVDTLNGAGGADVIYAGLGDIAHGGAQPDGTVDRIFVSFFGKDAALDLDLSTGDPFATLAAAAGGTYDGFEEIGVFGTVFSDTVIGSAGNDRLFDLAPADGQGGDDHIEGRGGDDRISAGSGSNWVDGGDGNDIIYDTSFETETLLGGAGDDIIFYGSSAPVDIIGNGADIIDGGDGVDQIDYSKLSVNLVVDLSKTVAQDTGFNILTVSNVENLRGGSGNDTFIGSSVANVLDGGLGADTLLGGLGNDTYYVDNAGDMIIEGVSGGMDTVISSVTYSIAGVYAENLTLMGTANLNATGNGQANVLTGNSGNNVLNGSTGADIMVGGMGDDTFIVDNAGDVVTELANEGTDTVQSSISYTLGANVENLTLAGAGRVGTGNALNNILTSSVSVDTLIGGAGDDTYVINNAADVVIEAVNGGTDTIISSVSYSIAAIYAENITLTGSLFLSATGNGMNNTLIGNSGNNILNGSVGADTMIGGAGSDNYYVDNAGDVVTELAGQGTDLVYALISYSLGANVENLALLGTNNIDATGNELNNFIFGNAGSNHLSAGAGADYLYGQAGNDLMDGGAGADAMYGGSGNDTYMVDNYADLCNEQSKGVGHDDGGIDLVISSANYQLTGFIENLTLTGTAVVGAGNASNNIILGNASGNYLFGVDGNDTLNGGAGGDALYGGTGADTFVFDHGSGFDVIGDFKASEGDMIDVHAYSNGVVGGAGIVITEAGASSVYVNMGGGNVVFVANASVADVTSHIVW